MVHFSPFLILSSLSWERAACRNSSIPQLRHRESVQFHNGLHILIFRSIRHRCLQTNHLQLASWIAALYVYSVGCFPLFQLSFFVLLNELIHGRSVEVKSGHGDTTVKEIATPTILVNVNDHSGQLPTRIFVSHFPLSIVCFQREGTALWLV